MPPDADLLRRLEIVILLLAGGAEPLCLCDLTGPLGLAQATISMHLKRLVAVGLVSREERGKWSYCSVDSGTFERVAVLADVPGAGRC